MLWLYHTVQCPDLFSGSSEWNHRHCFMAQTDVWQSALSLQAITHTCWHWYPANRQPPSPSLPEPWAKSTRPTTLQQCSVVTIVLRPEKFHSLLPHIRSIVFLFSAWSIAAWQRPKALSVSHVFLVREARLVSALWLTSPQPQEQIPIKIAEPHCPSRTALLHVVQAQTVYAGLLAVRKISAQQVRFLLGLSPGQAATAADGSLYFTWWLQYCRSSYTARLPVRCPFHNFNRKTVEVERCRKPVVRQVAWPTTE